MDVKLRDFFAAQIMSGSVDKFERMGVTRPGGVSLTREEATQEAIDKAAKRAYQIADAMIKARGEDVEAKQVKKIVKGSKRAPIGFRKNY